MNASFGRRNNIQYILRNKKSITSSDCNMTVDTALGKFDFGIQYCCFGIWMVAGGLDCWSSRERHRMDKVLQMPNSLTTSLAIKESTTTRVLVGESVCNERM